MIKMSSVLVLGVLGVVIIFGFQNCAEPFSVSSETSVLTTELAAEPNTQQDQAGNINPGSENSAVPDNDGNQNGGGSNNGSYPLTNTECNASGVTMSQLKSTNGHFNVTESGTIATNTTMSFPFIVNKSNYPYGISFQFEAGFSSGSYNMKDFSVSLCPGIFEGISSRCLRKFTSANTIVTDVTTSVNSACKIEAGKTYYLNVRPSISGQDGAAMINPVQR